jgi:HEAT repeat protein
MAGLRCFWSSGHDIDRLRLIGDVRSLIRLLGSPDFATRERTLDALGAMGSTAFKPLIIALSSREPDVRLGAVEALGIIRNPESVPALLDLIGRERNIEIRWCALLALGEIGDPSAIPVCETLLKDPSRYIRYGSAVTLRRLSWIPDDDNQRAYFFIALQEWSAVAALGKTAAGPLVDILKDDDPSVRIMIVELLGRIGGPLAQDACTIAIRDRRDSVRFRGVLSAIKSGLTQDQLPLLLARRERTGPDPFIAALLNFFFIGIGYNYMGKWWGFLVFMAYMSILVLAQFHLGPFVPSLLSYPVTGLLAIWTYTETRRMRDG